MWQQVTGVSAETDAGLGEVFSSLFPCASVTGAPRSRTMEIIRELESGPRGVYTGAIGLVKPGGRARFSVAIRTLTIDKKGARASYGVGGGIVWDSVPSEEWHESLIKGGILKFRPPPFRLLETLLYEPGKGVLLLDLHLDRLQASADYFGFTLDVDVVRDQLDSLRKEQSLRLRLLLEPGGSYEIEEHQLAEIFSPVRLRMAAEPVHSHDIFLFHKTTNREVYEKAGSDVVDCDDVILWNEKGELTETTISNLFLEIGGELLTPPVHCGLLAGTFRQQLLNEGKARQAILTRLDLAMASRIFVANSVRGMLEAVLVE